MRVVVDAYAWIPKNELTSKQLLTLKSLLTVIPRKVGDHPGEAPGPLYLYREEGDRIGVPRQFFLDRRKDRHQVEFEVTDGDLARWAGPLHFSGRLRSEQQKAVASTITKFRNGTLGGIIRADPGWGKTVAACALLAEMKVPTLVVVHKEFLMSQWKERIEQFLPGAKVGIAQQNMCDYTGKHVVIAMVHSLATENRYPRSFYRWPGLVITDEVHRIGAETWSPVPAQFSARYRLGISATPRRKDGADNVFRYHIGRVLFGATERRLKPKVRRVWTNFRVVKTERFNPALVSRSILVRFLCASRARNRLIVQQLKLAVEAGRKVLVLSERLNHLEALDAALAREMGSEAPSTGRYVGGMTQAERDESAQCQVIFATKQLASEGLDIPPLDTLFLVTPMSDVEQAVGRILRPFEGKKDPVVVDFRDNKVAKFKAAGESRDKFYRRIGA
jgi:superfamily II DNA or RNA helicase